MTKVIKKEKSRGLALISALLCGIVIVLTLYVPEPVGLGNNGDFTRTIYPNGIRYVNDDSSLYGWNSYVPEFEMVFSGDSVISKIYHFLTSDYSWFDYVTSQSPFIKLSKIFNVAANLITGTDIHHYDLVWLFVIYLIMYIWSIYMILRFIHKRLGMLMYILASLAFVFIFCDQGYTLYFNSFFGEALQYISTFTVIGLLLNIIDKHIDGKVSILAYILYYVAIIVMSASKNAYFLMGILFALIPLICLKNNALYPRKRKAITLAIAAISIGVTLFIASLTPSWIDEDTTYNSVFIGILEFSENSEEDLEELGLSPDLAVLKGIGSYDEKPIDTNTDEFRAEFFDKIGKIDIAIFYLKHPVRLINFLEYSAQYASQNRPAYLGNLINPSEPYEQSYRFSLWETFKSWVPAFRSLPVIVIVNLIAFILSLYLILKNKNIWLGLILLAAVISAVFNFVIPCMSNGIGDLAKHLFAYVYFFDIILVLLIGFVIARIQNRENAGT